MNTYVFSLSCARASVLHDFRLYRSKKENGITYFFLYLFLFSLHVSRLRVNDLPIGRSMCVYAATAAAVACYAAASIIFERER